MAVNYTPTTITSGYNTSKINTNFTAVDTALQDALSRSGNGPNQMEADIDMNSNDLLNVGALDAATITLGGEVVAPSTLTSLAPGAVTDGSVSTSSKLYNRINDVVSVSDYPGVDPTGVTASNAAFSAAALAASGEVELPTASENFPSAPVAYVRVPPGIYLIDELIDVGGKEIYWVLEPGSRITGNIDLLNGHVIRHDGSIVSKSHPYGIMYGAVGGASMIRSSLDRAPEITGLQYASQLSQYDTRDLVAFFAQGESVPALATITSPTYTSNRIYPPTPLSSDIVKRLRRGMLIDTVGTPVYSGAVSTWAADGSWIEVESGWFEVTGSPGIVTTPPNGLTAILNSFTKVWAYNGNVYLHDGHPANKATVMELGFLNETTTPMTNGEDLSQPYSWIYLAATLGDQVKSKASVHYISRGTAYQAFQSNNADIGFRVYSGPGTDTKGFVYDVGMGTAFEVRDVNAQKDTKFLITGTGDIEMGSQTVAGNPLIDFHSSGNVNDYDSRIIAVGGSATTGQGYLSVQGTHLNIQATGGLRVMGTKVVGEQGALVQNTTNNVDDMAFTINEILGRLRAHGLIGM